MTGCGTNEIHWTSLGQGYGCTSVGKGLEWITCAATIIVGFRYFRHRVRATVVEHCIVFQSKKHDRKKGGGIYVVSSEAYIMNFIQEIIKRSINKDRMHGLTKRVTNNERFATSPSAVISRIGPPTGVTNNVLGGKSCWSGQQKNQDSSCNIAHF